MTVRIALLRSVYSCQPLELAMTPDAQRLSQNTRRKARYSDNSALLKFFSRYTPTVLLRLSSI